MIMIRLQRRGTKKSPSHRIVATERSRSQGGRILEILGHYDPSYHPPQLTLDESRVTFWVSCGAQLSEAVSHLVKRIKRSGTSAGAVAGARAK